jgi:hypothetical protein
MGHCRRVSKAAERFRGDSTVVDGRALQKLYKAGYGRRIAPKAHDVSRYLPDALVAVPERASYRFSGARALDPAQCPQRPTSPRNVFRRVSARAGQPVP